MRRLGLLLLLLALCLSLAALVAQAQDDLYSDETAAYEEEETAPEEQEVAPISVSGRAVVDLAQSISNAVADLGAIPDWSQITTLQGRRSLSAADAFILLARTAYRWEVDGDLPARVSLIPGAVSPPVLDDQDFPDAALDLEAGREIATDAFLSQAGECLRWADQFQVVPTAVWVDGERLSAAEYLAGLAICLEYSYYSGYLEETLYLPDYSPPPAWVEHTELLAEELGEEAVAEEAVEEDLGIVPPVLALREVPRLVKPTITLLPAPGSKVSGVVDLVVSYSGPPAEFITFAVDGQTKGITNSPPYGYRWNTAQVKPGKHEITVRAFGENAVEIMTQKGSYTVTAPQPEKAAGPKAPKS